MINVSKRANQINWETKYQQLKQTNQELKESFRTKCIESFKSRRSVRQILEKKPNFKIIEDIIEAGINAPCAGNIQNYKIIIIENKITRKKIGEFTYNQFWINKTPYVLIILRDEEQLKESYPDYWKLYSKQNVGVLIENIIMAIHMSKLSTCWIGIKNDNMIREILEIPDKYEIDAVIPIGYPNEIPYVENRADNTTLINFETFNNKIK